MFFCKFIDLPNNNYKSYTYGFIQFTSYRKCCRTASVDNKIIQLQPPAQRPKLQITIQGTCKRSSFAAPTNPPA